MAIQIIDGFQVNIASPIDNRIVASGSSARNSIPYKYEGLRVFDLSNGIPYVWYNGAWVSENATGVAGVGTTTNYIPRYTSTNVIGNSIIYQLGSSIGINTLVPSATFSVNGSLSATTLSGDGQSLTNLNASNLATGTVALNRLPNGSNGWILSGGSGVPAYVNPTQITVGTSSVANSIAINNTTTNATHYLTFISSGAWSSTNANAIIRANLGIGYNPSTNILTTGGITASNYVSTLNGFYSYGGTLSNTLNTKKILMNLYINTGNNDNLEFSKIRTTGSSGWQNAGYRIQSKVDSSDLGYIQFNGNNDTGISFGTGYSATERLRIDILGRVLANTTTPISSNCILHLKSDSSLYDGLVHQSFNDSHTIFEFKNTSGVQRGRIVGNGTGAVLYNTSSDRRLKDNIQEMPSMYNVIKELKPSKFNWKSGNKEDYGFIAQDVYRLIPNLRGEIAYCDVNSEDFDIENPIKTDGDPYYYGLDYGKLTPFLTKALQETIERLETLTDKIKNASSLDELKSSL